ncbi:MAG: hypothetical protein IIU11_04420 [Bacteroidales bacterium]|nr:hypothetical protein [Bacteroidales bacterium]
MKKYILLTIVITLGLFLFAFRSYSNTKKAMDIKNFFKEKFSLSGGEFSYEEAWKQVAELERKNKTNDAYKKVKDILSHAQKDKNYPQIIKTYIYSLDYQNQTVDDGFFPELKKMESELDNFPPADKAVMHSVLGQIYMNYLDKEYFAISKRTDVDVKDGNLQTYSTQQILREAKAHFEKSVAQAEDLKAKKIEDYKDILSGLKSDFSSASTLYDFLLNRALTQFYKKESSRYEVFDDIFDNNNQALLGEQNEFLNLKFDEKIYGHLSSYQVFLIYQKLINTHKDDADKSLLIYNDLKRLEYFRRQSMLADRDFVLLSTLENMEKTYASFPEVKLIKWKIAELYYAAEDFVKAHKKAEEILGSDSNAKAMIFNIEKPDFSCVTEKYLPHTSNIVFRIKHKNIDKVYFRIGKISKDFFETPDYNNKNYLEKFQKAMSDVQNYDVNVEKSSDYKYSNSTYALPATGIGYYAVLISDDKNFKEGTVSFSLIQVTDIIAVSSQNTKDGTTTVKVLDRKSGFPVEGATVKILGEEYKNNKWVWTLLDKKLSDKNGDCVFDRNVGNYKGYSINFTVEKDKDFLDRDNIYFSKSSEKQKETFYKVFTDRALYRPGHTVYFKVLCYDKLGKEINVNSGKKITVLVRDINRQKVFEKDFTTNEFGTVSGSFQLGTSVVLGNYTFSVNSSSTSCSFSVEEYKRPTFEVLTDQTTGEIALNQDVKVKGSAKTYSGVKVENAEVKYKVTRIPKFFGWWYFYYDLQEKLIETGRAQTDENGEFELKFLARPDKSLPEDLGLTFTYRVDIDVTAPDGETQSKTHYVSVGYAGIFLGKILNSDLYFKGQNSFKKLEISASNALGSPVECQIEISVKKLKNFLNPLPDNDLYKLEDEKLVKTLSLKSSEKADLSFIEDLEDGNYCVLLKTKDSKNHEITSESRFTLVSEKCKKTDFNKYFWYHNFNPTCEPGEKAKIVFGTSQKDLMLWYEVFQGDNLLIPQKRIKLSQGTQTIEIPIVEENRGGISVRFFFVKDNTFFNETVSISVPYTNKKIDIKYESFRDKLEPGENETIKLKILDKNLKPVDAELLATLYDESLDAIRANNWYLSCYDYNRICPAYTVDKLGDDYSRNIRSVTDKNFYHSYSSLEINWFGHEIYSFGRPNNLYYSMGRGVREKGVVYESCMVLEDNALDEETAEVSLATDANGADENDKEFEDVKVRENFAETAFFSSNLVTDAEGNLSIQFTVPESLTKWHFMAMAHTRDMKYAFSDNHLITQKSFMVEPNLPRFFLETDKIVIPVKISNLTDKKLTGKLKIEILDAQTQQPVNDYKISEKVKDFSVEASRTQVEDFTLEIPKRPEPVIVKIVGVSKEYSDGSQKFVPVLTTRTLITESQSFNIRANQTKNYVVQSLKNQSKTQDNQSFMFEFTSNPAWLAFMSLPYLRETDVECYNSVFSRYYANMLAQKIIKSNPSFEKTYSQLTEEDFKSALEKNQELKSILLSQTPWLLDAKDESAQMKKIEHLFNSEEVDKTNKVFLKKLSEGQYSDGGWPWFKGMKQSLFVTQEILCGLGRLIHLGAIENSGDINKMTEKAVSFIDKALEKDYKELKKILSKKDLEKYHPSYYDIQYFYARSFFLDKKVPKSTQEAYDFFLTKLVDNWTDFSMYAQALISTTLKRLGKEKVAKEIVDAFKNNAQNSEEFGMYYSKNLNGYHWYNSPVETQAMIIESFAEFGFSHEVEELKIWLIKNKQTNSWKSSRATTEAVYALLMNGEKLSVSEQPCTIKIGGEVLSEVASEGSAYVKKAYPKEEISSNLTQIEVVNPNNHIAYGACYLQYFEEYQNVKATANGLTLKKEIYKIEKDALGQDVAILVTPQTPLHQGDRLKARFVITTDRDLEYVFLKDVHSSAFEPLNKLSGGRYQDGLFYYESTKDACEEFFIEFMQRGTYVFEYPLVAVHKGVLTNGIATIECMYAPEFRANSTSQKVKVE